MAEQTSGLQEVPTSRPHVRTEVHEGLLTRRSTSAPGTQTQKSTSRVAALGAIATCRRAARRSSREHDARLENRTEGGEGRGR